MSTSISRENMSEVPTVGQDSRDASIEFHKHCQATICSAFGTAPTSASNPNSGNGRSWHILDDLDLSALPSGWKSQFISNRGNMTQDLASILTIMNDVAQARQQAISMTIMSGNREIPITFSNGGTLELGRRIQLSIDG